MDLDWDQPRFSVYKNIIVAIMEKPIIGYGFGNFADIFPVYRSQEVSECFDRGHSEYLELILTAGIPVFALLLVLFFAVLTKLKKSMSDRSGNFIVGALGLTCSLQIIIHALIDFPLQIPVISYFFVTILANALRQNLSLNTNRNGFKHTI